MKKQGRIGYWISIKFQLRFGSGSGPRNTIPENTCITGKEIHRHNGVEYVLLQHQIFDGHRIPTFFIICRASNQSIWSLRLASTTADLIPYPFGSGTEEQIPVLPSRIQVPVPALYNGSYNS